MQKYYHRVPIESSLPKYSASGKGLIVKIKGRSVYINRFFMAFYIRANGNITPRMMISYVKDNINRKYQTPWFPREYRNGIKTGAAIAVRYQRIAANLVENGVLQEI